MMMDGCADKEVRYVRSRVPGLKQPWCIHVKMYRLSINHTALENILSCFVFQNLFSKLFYVSQKEENANFDPSSSPCYTVPALSKTLTHRLYLVRLLQYFCDRYTFLMVSGQVNVQEADLDARYLSRPLKVWRGIQTSMSQGYFDRKSKTC